MIASSNQPFIRFFNYCA